MTGILETATVALAMLLGVMLFFSFVVAPQVFRQLEAAEAGRVIRALFPWYYAVVIALSLIATIALAPARPLVAGFVGLVLASALFARQWLMHRINAASDASQRGDSAARRRFGRLHGWSVVINLIQMVLVAVALVWVTVA